MQGVVIASPNYRGLAGSRRDARRTKLSVIINFREELLSM